MITLKITKNDAGALHWLARHLNFNDALQSTPPHLGKQVRTERAYNIIHAASQLQRVIEDAGLHGDGWMYEISSDHEGTDR